MAISNRRLIGLLAIPAGFFCLIAVLRLASDDERLATTAASKFAAPSLDIEPPDSEEKDVKQRVKNSIRHSIRSSLRSVHLSNAGELEVTIRASEQGSLAESLLTLESDIAKILRCAREANKELFWKKIKVIVVSWAPDDFGRNSNRIIFDAWYWRSTVRKIRWDSFEVVNVSKIRDGGPGWDGESLLEP